MRPGPLLLFLLIAALASQAARLDAVALQSDFLRISQNSDGRVGACAGTTAATACLHATERFPMQSVMKLLVAVATLDRIDAGAFNLSGIIIHKQDLSLYVQPIADLVGPSGYRTTIGDLIRRAVIQSDSAATDILISRLGGPPAVQSILTRKGISAIRIDRDERHLQTEIVGLAWHPEFVNPALLDQAISQVPSSRRTQAWREYRKDSRDTATPEAMAAFLLRLAQGKLLSQSSTAFVLQAMRECATFPNRLKAGVSPGWQISHKTGTSGSWQGVVAATNDVGILTAPDRTQISVAVFIADSGASAVARAKIMAEISAATIARYR